jgi:hypothetical protein
MRSYVNVDELVDEIAYLRLGQKEVYDIVTIEHGQLALSYIDDFTSGNWKIAGFSLYRHLNQIQYTRATYDFLTMLGDIGGLYKALFLFGGLFLKPLLDFMKTVIKMPFLFYYRVNAEQETVYNHLSFY